MPQTRRLVRPLVVATIVAAVTIAGGLAISPLAQSGDPAPGVISVQVSRPGAAIAPTMFGVFFEDINFAADGGLYPERVKNRSFEFDEPLAGWAKRERGAADGELVISTDRPLNPNNPHYLRIRVHAPGGGFGASNAGFRGMGVEAGATYIVSAFVRARAGGPTTLKAALTDERGGVLAETALAGFASEWKRHEGALTPAATTARAQLRIMVEEPGEIDVDMVSLFPADTWRGRPNGLRKDLVQLLADLKPGFIRFPGGCIVEGRRLALRYQWKKTVGDVAERQGIINRWADENDRIAPDYYQSFGLGFFEYFQLAEDIGARPLPILNCGMACQFNSGEMAPLDQLGEYIQDALDLIEFANGPATSRWGGLRARMGHPAPFGLEAIGIGNEQWGTRYLDRYERFASVLKAKHPEIQLVTSAGPFARGEMFDLLWGRLRAMKADIVDEHYYMPPAWFLANAGRYDTYDRSGPRVFAGEYAAHTPGSGRDGRRNNWEAALAEAAFITGLERNADLVRMASYAPLFAHVDAWQWAPNLIWFDNLRSFGTPSYYVQKMFGTNAGTRALPVTIGGKPAAAQDGLYASAALDERAGELVVKVVNVAPGARAIRLALDGAAPRGTGRMFVLSSGDLKAENSLDQPRHVAPVESAIEAAGSELRLNLSPQSLTVVRLPLASPPEAAPPMTSQHAEDVAVTLPKQAGAWIRPDEPRRITEETIFDYMDGAGELYLAYRFGHLDVYVYAAPEKALGEIRVELYWMRSPDDAFGLLSVDWGGEPVDLAARGAAREDRVPAVPSHDALYGGGLLRFRSGSLYGRVMASRESPGSREQVLAIARSIVKGRPANGRPPAILRRWPERLEGGFTLRPDRTCFFRSHYVLNSMHYLAPDDVLGLGPAVDAVIGEYRPAPQGSGPVRLIGIMYPTPDAAAAGMAAFLKSLPPGGRAEAPGRLAPSAARAEGGWFGWAAQNRYLTIVLGAPGEDEAKAMAGAALESLSRR